MKDKHALLIRELVTRYGMGALIEELLIVARAYSGHDPKRWNPYRRALKGAVLNLRIGR